MMSDLFGGSGFDPQFIVPMDPNLTDLDKLDQMREEWQKGMESMAQEMGVDLDQMRNDMAYLDPTQPMVEFVDQWQSEDGTWLGDPRERSSAYLEALDQMMERSLMAIFAPMMLAAEQPPWDNPDTMAVLDGSAIAEAFGGVVQQADAGPVGAWPEVAPDGTTISVEGLDPYWQMANLDAVQGDEVPGFQGTCGLTSVANVAQMFGVELTEGQVVEFAAANGLCVTDSPEPGGNGGTLESDQVKLLEAAGIPAHAERGRGLDDLASYIDANKGVIVELNAGVVWDDPSAYDGGKANHAVTLTGVARDESGNIAGFFICDSGSREGRDFVPADEMREGWENTGGSCVVTDNPRSQGYPPGQGGPQFT